MKSILPFAFLLAVVSSESCSQPGFEYRESIRIAGAVVDSVSTDVNTDSTLYEYSVKEEYSSLEVGLGAYVYKDGEKKGLAELAVSQTSYADLDALEVALGGRFFLGQTESFHPYASLYWVSSFFEQDGSVNSTAGAVGGIDPGTYGSIRAGVGTEYRMGPSFFLDASLRYLLPIMDGNTVGGWADNGVESIDFSGFSVFLGMGFEFGK